MKPIKWKHMETLNISPRSFTRSKDKISTISSSERGSVLMLPIYIMDRMVGLGHKLGKFSSTQKDASAAFITALPLDIDTYR
jgi:hypothetical protein